MKNTFVLQQTRKVPHYKGEAQSQHCFFSLLSPLGQGRRARQPEYDPFLAVLDNFSLNDKIVQ